MKGVSERVRNTRSRANKKTAFQPISNKPHAHYFKKPEDCPNEIQTEGTDYELSEASVFQLHLRWRNKTRTSENVDIYI